MKTARYPNMRRARPFCRMCHERKRGDEPRLRELGMCWRCYQQHHEEHVCPCDGCPECEG